MFSYTKCNYKSIQTLSGIMPMSRNVQSNRVREDWIDLFLQSVLQGRKGIKTEG
jgi:hypothetical protein